MMEDLLRFDFTTHYGLPNCTETNFSLVTSETYFEIDDTDSKNIVIQTSANFGMAKVANPNRRELLIINYDKFVSSLPYSFHEKRKRCDIIISDNADYVFVLGELKDRDISNSKKSSRVRKAAREQLYQSLVTLLTVPSIQNLVNDVNIRRCCYFNKQSNAPSLIKAVIAFNRLPNAFLDGFQMENPEMESQNFEFWEYTGNQTLQLI
jgi:hypothetical protein